MLRLCGGGRVGGEVPIPDWVSCKRGTHVLMDPVPSLAADSRSEQRRVEEAETARALRVTHLST
jgi:hypothetical protein